MRATTDNNYGTYQGPMRATADNNYMGPMRAVDNNYLGPMRATADNNYLPGSHESQN